MLMNKKELQSRPWLKTIFQHTMDAIVLGDDKGRCIDANPAACKLSGYTRKELIGKTLRDVTLPKYQRYVPKVWKAFLSVGKMQGVHKLMRKDGTTRVGEFTAVANILPGVHLCSYRDVTDRGSVEDKVRFQSSLLDQVRESVIAVDTNYKIIYWNRGAENLYQWKAKEAIGKNVIELLVARAIQHEGNKVLNTVERKGHWEGDFECVRKDGTRILISVRNARLEDREKRYIGAVGVSSDITERRRAELELRRSERWFSTIFRLGPVAIAITRARDGLFLDANDRYLQLFKYTRKELIGKTVLELNIWAHPEQRPPAIDRLIREPSLRDCEIQFRKKGGETFDGLLAVDLVSMTSANDGILIVSIVDMTEQKMHAEQIRASQDQLRALSARLQSIREEERTRISREIHDELGQALTALKLDLSWLRLKLPPMTQMAQDKIKSMAKLIDSTIHSVRSISTELRPGVLDNLGLGAAIEWQTQEFQKRTGIQCRFHEPEDLDIGKDRSTILFRILQELLTNVARHSKATRVEIDLKREGSNLILEVRDNGTGIPKKLAEARSSLGILGMRERAALFQGEVIVNGIQKKGTTVTVSIPSK